MADVGSVIDKVASLKDLEARLRAEFDTADKRNIWLFPSGDSEQARDYLQNSGRSVRGFWGTGEKPRSENVIMIIAERPSVGNKSNPKEFDANSGRFYEILEKNGLSNSHLTDFIKTRAPVNYIKEKQKQLKFYEREFDRHLPYLREEIRIIKPNKIVALGEKTFLWVAVCKSFLELKGTELFFSPHYANRFKEGKIRFERDFESVCKML